MKKNQYTIKDAFIDTCRDMREHRETYEEKKWREWQARYDAAGPIKQRFMTVCDALNQPATIPCVVLLGVIIYSAVRAVCG